MSSAALHAVAEAAESPYKHESPNELLSRAGTNIKSKSGGFRFTTGL